MTFALNQFEYDINRGNSLPIGFPLFCVRRNKLPFC